MHVYTKPVARETPHKTQRNLEMMLERIYIEMPGASAKIPGSFPGYHDPGKFEIPPRPHEPGT